MTSPDIDRIISTNAHDFSLPYNLVHAVVEHESSRRIFAFNPEPPYRYYWDVAKNAPFRKCTDAELKSESPPADFPFLPGYGPRDAEWWGQAASWGLMQVMGAVARELGMKGDIASLCDPEIGVQFGCMHLANLRKRFYTKFGYDGVVAAYNAGSPRVLASGVFENQIYVDAIHKAGGMLP